MNMQKYKAKSILRTFTICVSLYNVYIDTLLLIYVQWHFLLEGNIH
jgi:hypothetical protein